MSIMKHIFGKAKKEKGASSEYLLHDAARDGNIEEVKRLIETGWEIDKTNINEFTALHLAAREGHLEIAKLLIDKGADVMARAQYGETPLLMAITSRWAAKGNPEVVRYLIEHGADLQAMDDDGWTPLYAAAERASVQCAEVLIEAGAPIAQLTNFGQTALQRAIMEKDNESEKENIGKRKEMIALLQSQNLHSRSQIEGDIATINKLLKGLATNDMEKQTEATEELVRMGTDALESLIVATTYEGSKEHIKRVRAAYRKGAIFALGEIGDSRAAESLIQIIKGYATDFTLREEIRANEHLTEDEHVGIFREAKAALEKMGYQIKS